MPILFAIFLLLAGGAAANEPDPVEAEEAARLEATAACRADLHCWADEHEIDAGVECRLEIERRAQYAHRWIMGWAEPRFSHRKWGDGGVERGRITYAGDRLEFQNAFGAWQPQVYVCEFDPETGKAVAVNVRPGRI